MVKIVTYNVNGLRPRVAQHGSLRRLLDALDADIICFQETKLSRQDLSGDVIMAEGYEAFISCNRTSRGRGAYSGVATFCRVASAFSSQAVALPVAAEEGFAGLQGSAKDSETIGDFVLQMPVEEEGLGEVTREELLRLDNEGRCVITDHGHFVLFNLYGPAISEDDEERVRFKLLFYKILQKRWECLLALGKRVFIVGDLNIAPGSIDRCDAPPGFEKQMFREWLRSMLKENGGPFFDAFRSKHPERTGAYTCFNQKVGAEEYNYGSRIDHILISGACFHHGNSVEDHSIFRCHVEDCEIMNHFRRRGDSENISKWKGGRSSKLEGSDHTPVFIILNGIPELPVHNTPPSAARYLPEIRGRQQSIVSFLSKGKIFEVEDGSGSKLSQDRANESCCIDDLESKNISKEELPTGVTDFSKGGNLSSPTCKRRNLDHWINEGSNGNSQNSNATSVAPHGMEDFSKGGDLPSPTCKRSNLDHWINEGSSGNSQNSTAKFLPPHGMKASFSGIKSMSNKKNKHSLSSQPTIKSFFRRPETRTGDANITSLVSSVDTVPGMDELCYSKDDSLPDNIQCTAPAEVDQDSSISCSLSTDNYNVATLEWQRIQQRMKMTLPLCKGHREPCIPRSVKKGSNIGRQFYVCSRAQGPSSNPEANCNHFQWASAKSKGKRQ